MPLTVWFSLGVGDYREASDGDRRGCEGQGDFGDLVAGAEVTVRDGDGVTVGSAGLPTGEVLIQDGAELCHFAVIVMVEEADDYDIRVAGRDGDAFTRTELEAAGWEVGLTLGLVSPDERPTVTPTPPPVEVPGQLSILVDEAGVELSGAALCRTEPGARRVAGITANEMGLVGGHRIFMMLELEPLPGGRVQVELGQGGESMPAGPIRSYIGEAPASDVDVRDDLAQGSLRFIGLTAAEPFLGVDWPSSIGGRIEWRCDEIPDVVPPDPYPGQDDEPVTTGSAALTGGISGTFEIDGSDCPTPSSPGGFLSGLGSVDGRAAILEISFFPEAVPEVGFVLYRTPGDKYDMVRGLPVPVLIEPADDRGYGWRAGAVIAAGSAGTVVLELEWQCGP